MTYPLLENAPAQETEAFIDYLREKNEVVYETEMWLVIENCKFHKESSPHYTAFVKNEILPEFVTPSAMEDFMAIIKSQKWQDWEWRKNPVRMQTVRGRFHIHLLK